MGYVRKRRMSKKKVISGPVTNKESKNEGKVHAPRTLFHKSQSWHYRESAWLYEYVQIL